MSSFGRDEGRTLPPSVDAFINMRDLVVGDNDWYNVTPSVRRAIEGFALILRDHEARLMNGGGESIGSPIGRTNSSSAAEVTTLKERIARLEEELAVTKRRVAEVTNVAVTAASDAKGAVIESHSIRPDVDRLQHGLSSLHTAVGAHLKDIRGKVANAGSNPGTPTAGMNGESPGVDDLRRRVRDLEGDVERFFNEGGDGASGGTTGGVARRVAALEDNQKTLERRTQRVERVVDDVRSLADRRARAEETERLRELRLGGGGEKASRVTNSGRGRGRRGSSSSDSSPSEDEETWHGSSGKKDDPIALLAGASVSTGLHGGFG